jgi:hypothetical protein
MKINKEEKKKKVKNGSNINGIRKITTNKSGINLN